MTYQDSLFYKLSIIINEWQIYLLAFLLFSGLTLAVTLADPSVQRVLTQEDGLVENATALFYFTGAALSLVALLKGRYVLVSSIWCVLCVIFLGEETSWFQRLLGYSVPSVEIHNAQSEFNVHNLNIFQADGAGKKFIEDDGHFRFAIRKLCSAQSFFRMGLICYFLIFPLLLLWSNFRIFTARFEIPPFDYPFLGVMWLTIVVTFIFTLTSEPIARDAISEIREMLISMFILYYVATFATPRFSLFTNRLRTV